MMKTGWRGPIANTNKDSNWKKKIESIKIDPTLNWQFAEVEDVGKPIIY